MKLLKTDKENRYNAPGGANLNHKYIAAYTTEAYERRIDRSRDDIDVPSDYEADQPNLGQRVIDAKGVAPSDVEGENKWFIYKVREASMTFEIINGSVADSYISALPNTQYTITVIPNSGYKFYRWADTSTENPRVFTVGTTPTTYTATCVPDYAYVEFGSDGYGTVTLTADGVEMTSPAYIKRGATVVLKSTPNTGYTFKQWSDGSTDNPRTFIMGDTDITLEATHEEMPKLEFTCDFGTITATVNDKFVESGVYCNDGDEVYLYCNTNAGYHFTNWYYQSTRKVVVSTSPIYRFKMNGDIRLIAECDPLEAFHFHTDGLSEVSLSKVYSGTHVQYSRDGGSTWTYFDDAEAKIWFSDDIYFKATGYTWDHDHHFQLYGDPVYAYGRVTDLIDNGAGTTTIAPENAFNSMFLNCDKLVTPPDMSNLLSLGKYSCSYMFAGCSNLTTPPDFSRLLSIQLDACRSMFKQCTSLTYTPVIPTVSYLDIGAFERTFDQCTALTQAMDLRFISVVKASACSHMYVDCTALKGPIYLPRTPYATNKVSAVDYMFHDAGTATGAGGVMYTYGTVSDWLSSGANAKIDTTKWTIEHID